MRLPRPLRRDVVLDFGAGKATATDATRALRKALQRTAASARAADHSTELCLIGQVRGGSDYTAQRRYWLRKARGWSAQGWDERLPSGGHALYLAPVAPTAAAKSREHPKPTGVPGYIAFNDPLPAESAMAIAISVWLEQVAARDFDAVALAPPILERYARGRLVRREVVDYGLEWPLAAAL